MFTPTLAHADLDHVLAHTRADWEQLRGRRLFVTGGTGFFGMWLVESFLWANERLNLGAEAVVLSRDPAAFLRKMPHLAGQSALSFHSGDVRTFDFPIGGFSHVIHAATHADNPWNPANPLEIIDVAVSGTRHALDFARQCGARKFLLTSSGAVYGKQPPEVTHIPEEFGGSPDPMDSRLAHGQARRLAEHLCAIYAGLYGIESKIARGFAFAGPYLQLDSHFAIGNFISDGLRGGPIVVRGDGAPYRSYLYAADLAIWLWTILFQARTCRPYNVGSEEAVTLGELASKVAGIFQPACEVRVLRSPDPSSPVERYVPSTRRAAAELGLAPKVDLQQAIERTVQFHRSRNID